MRSVYRLVESVRQQTENEEFNNEFIGISDDEIIRYLNDAQYNIQALITNKHPRAFINEVVINTVSGQEEYALPTDCFLGNKVHNVEFSATGRPEDYYSLEQETIKSRISGVDGSPTKYIRMSGKILLVPQPSSGGKLRINYVQRLRELDKRQAKVSDTSANTTSLRLNFDGAALTTDTDSLEKHEYLCIVDKLGKSLASNLSIIRSDTGRVDSDFIRVELPEETFTMPSNTDVYVVGGLDTTTHSSLDISVERYLISYAAFKVLKRDSSVDSVEAAQELSAMAQEIVSSYSLITDDIQYIPQLNSWEDWSV